jgi:two-component system LytT family sensor kinase
MRKLIVSARRALAGEALRPALIVWGFGYILVDLFAMLQGRTVPGLMLLSSIPLFVSGVALTLLLDRLRRRVASQAWLPRSALLLAGVAAAAMAQTLIDMNYLRWLALSLFPEWQAWALNMGIARMSGVVLLYLWTFALALTLLWAARIGGAAEASAARAAAFEAASHRAEAAALRLQLNPHFLFNALNSISSLVTLDRKAEAEEMIGQLADFLRASITSDPMADVALAEEIDTIDAYLGIESARFGERLEVEIDAPDDVLGASVPNFILQPLVENAIKHGVAATRGRALIRVAARREGEALVLEVVNRSDGGQITDPPREARIGIGLDNIRQRLAIAHGCKGRLSTESLPDGYRASIHLPLRQMV